MPTCDFCGTFHNTASPAWVCDCAPSKADRQRRTEAVHQRAALRPVNAAEREQQAKLELQLARAIGKTIQRKDWAANRWCFAWEDVPRGQLLRDPSTEYRVKPD